MSDRPKSRKIKTARAAGASDVLPNSFNMQSGGLKTVGPIIGSLVRLSDPTTPIQLDDSGAVIALYNNSGTTQWLLVGQDVASVAAAPTAINGIALRPNDYTHVALGEMKAFHTSASVIAYLLEDDTYIA